MSTKSLLTAFTLVVVWCSLFESARSIRYEPTWESLDKRPLPEWYDEAKFGIFLHWGVYSVPAFGSAWFWYYLHNKQPSYVDFMKKNYRPGFTYGDFANQFHAEFYDPKEWVEVFKDAGAR